MTDSVDRLKELLFDRETETLGDLARRIELVAETERLSYADLKSRLDDIKAKAVMGEELSPRVAAVLDEIIRDAEENRHDEVANAIAPLVVRTIKTELKNSQDEMVQVLFPITGRMVKAYVASAINDMMAKINRRLEQNSFMLRMRSVISGRSVAELALVDEEKLTCEELFLIRRGVGALIARWPERGHTAENDSHMSNVLAAINEYAAHNFQDDGGNVRSLVLDDSILYMRASPLYLLAAKCRGTPMPGIDDALDREFLSVTETLAQTQRPAAVGAAVAEDVSEQHLAGLATRIDARVGEAHEELARAGLPFSPFKAIAALIILPLAAWIGWMAYTSWEVAQTQRVAQKAMEETAELNGYPLRLDVGPRGRSVSFEGLAPSQQAKSALLARVNRALPDVAVRDRITLLPNAPADPEPRIAEVRRQLTALESELATAAVRRALDRAQRRLENTMPDLAQLGASGNESHRRQAGEATRAVEQSIRELTTYRTVALGQGSDRAALNALNEPLGAVTTRLSGTAGSLAALLSGSQARAPAAAGRPAAAAGVVEIAEDLALTAERVATVAAAVAQTSTIRIPEPPPPPPPPVVTGPTAREQLATFARTHAVFFANGDEYRAQAQADQVLTSLIALLNQTTEMVRVVGYTDERGGLQRNAPLAQSRAERVVADLVARGIPRDRLVAVGRPNGPDLSPSIGPDSPNRRVEFEIGFPGEAPGGRP